MSLVKYQIACQSCEYEGFVVSNTSDDKPSYCPQCGQNLNDQKDDDSKGGEE